MPPGNGSRNGILLNNGICAFYQDKEATTVVNKWDTWHGTHSKLPTYSDCALKSRQTHLT